MKKIVNVIFIMFIVALIAFTLYVNIINVLGLPDRTGLIQTLHTYLNNLS